MDNAVDANMYYRVFVEHAEGRMILEDLTGRFHDSPLFVPGAQEGERQTNINLGKREVVSFILRRIGQVKEGDPNETEVL